MFFYVDICLGLRTVSEARSGSRLVTNSSNTNSSGNNSTDVGNRRTQSAYYQNAYAPLSYSLDSQSDSGGIVQHSNSTNRDSNIHYTDEEEELIPSALHKYSAEMRDSQFSYFTDDEPSLVPSFNLRVV